MYVEFLIFQMKNISNYKYINSRFSFFCCIFKKFNNQPEVKNTLLFIIALLFIQKSFSQVVRVPGPAEQKLTDSLCAALNRLDLSKINSSTEAKSAFMNSFMQQAPMLEAVANERKVAIEDKTAMHQVGLDIGKDLLKENCSAFLKLAAKMAEKEGGDKEEASGTATGSFKRFDLKGFNYLVIGGQDNSEKSFLWLRQFPGSENFMNGTTKFAGKKLKVTWQEIEAYLPQAKGYYKIKEIIGIEVL